MLPDHRPDAARIRRPTDASGGDRQSGALAAGDGQGGRPSPVHPVSQSGPMIAGRRAGRRPLGCLLVVGMTLLTGCTLGPSQRPALATFGTQQATSVPPASTTP